MLQNGYPPVRKGQGGCSGVFTGDVEYMVAS
jgi:hypothetical protein